MKRKLFDTNAFLSSTGTGRIIQHYQKNRRIFSQGDLADTLFYIQNGKVKLTIVSPQGKEAVVALSRHGDFFGEGCLAGQVRRMVTATAMDSCSVMRIEKKSVTRVLHDEPAFSALFLRYVLSRNIKIEEDLVDHLFNSSEKRLARTLLLLARYGDANAPRTVPKISQETLAEMIGATRSRVNFFMNKFRKLGLIEYNGGLKINSSLLSVVLHD